MSFWDQYGLPPSAIGEILGREHELSELLTEEDVLQECKHGNADLVSELSRVESVEEMLSYIVMEPPADEASLPASELAKKKLPYVSSEIFACKIEPMLRAAIENKKCLDVLFSVLDRTSIDRPGEAAYFGKVVNVLVDFRAAAVLEYMVESGVLPKMIRHLQNHSVLEIFKNLWSDQLHKRNADAQRLRLAQQGVVAELVRALSPDMAPVLSMQLGDAEKEMLALKGRHANAARALISIIENGPAQAIADDVASAAAAGKKGDKKAKKKREREEDEEDEDEQLKPVPGGKEALVAQLEAEDCLQQLLAFTFPEGLAAGASVDDREAEILRSCQMRGLSVVSALLERRVPLDAEDARLLEEKEKNAAVDAQQMGGDQLMDMLLGAAGLHNEDEEEEEEDEDEVDEEARAQAAAEAEAAASKSRARLTYVITSLLRFTPNLVAMLEPREQEQPLEMQYGTLSPPLGPARLNAVSLLSALTRAAPVLHRQGVEEVSAQVVNAIVEHRVFPSVLNLMLRYEFNTMLHRQVERMLRYIVFISPSEAEDSAAGRLKRELFGEHGDLLGFLFTADRKNVESLATKPTPESTGHGMRLGFMAFVNKLAIALLEASEEEIDGEKGENDEPTRVANPRYDAFIAAKLQERGDEWADYCTREVEPARKNRSAELGGPRPDKTLGPGGMPVGPGGDMFAAMGIDPMALAAMLMGGGQGLGLDGGGGGGMDHDLSGGGVGGMINQLDALRMAMGIEEASSSDEDDDNAYGGGHSSDEEEDGAPMHYGSGGVFGGSSDEEDNDDFNFGSTQTKRDTPGFDAGFDADFGFDSDPFDTSAEVPNPFESPAKSGRGSSASEVAAAAAAAGAEANPFDVDDTAAPGDNPFEADDAPPAAPDADFGDFPAFDDEDGGF